jgi:hypothetical protein
LTWSAVLEQAQWAQSLERKKKKINILDNNYAVNIKPEKSLTKIYISPIRSFPL